MTRAVWVGQARVWVAQGLPGLIYRTASARDATLARYSTCLHRVSVRPSDTRWYCTKMAKPRITQTTPYFR